HFAVAAASKSISAAGSAKSTPFPSSATQRMMKATHAPNNHRNKAALGGRGSRRAFSNAPQAIQPQLRHQPPFILPPNFFRKSAPRPQEFGPVFCPNCNVLLGASPPPWRHFRRPHRPAIQLMNG